MTEVDKYPWHQNFQFHLEKMKFMTGHISLCDDGYFTAGVSIIRDVETPLPTTFNRTIICDAHSTAALAFEEIVKTVKKESGEQKLNLRLVVNSDKEKHLNIEDENSVLAKHYDSVAVQPYV
jgi:hypothetical protein